MIRLQQKKLLQERRNTRQPQQSEQQLMKMQMRRLQSLFSSKNNVMFKLSKSYTEVFKMVKQLAAGKPYARMRR